MVPWNSEPLTLLQNTRGAALSRRTSVPLHRCSQQPEIRSTCPPFSSSQALRHLQIVKVLKDGQCKIKYDDGDKWTGDARYIMRLTGSAPTVSTLVQAVPDGPVLVAAPAIPQATVVPAQAVAVDASVVA